jgi:ATP-binding cassette subfamily B multidrug efflux pump
MPRRGEEMMAKPRNTKKAFLRFGGEFHSQIGTIILLVILNLGSAVLSVINPIILKDIIGNISQYLTNSDFIAQVDWPGLFAAFGKMMAFAVGASLLSFISDWVGGQMGDVYSYNLRKRIKDKLDKMPLAYFDGQNYGEILSKSSNDVDNINRNLYSILSQSVVGVGLLIGTTIAMFVTSWQLALVVLASYPLMAVAVFFIASKSKKQYKKYRAKYGSLESMVEEDYAGYKIVKLFSQEETAQETFDAINEEMSAADRKSQWISGFIFPTMRFIYLIGFVAVSVVSGLVYKNVNGLGTLAAFLMFLNLAQQPFQTLGQIAGTIQSVAAAGERVFDLLDAPEESKDPVDAITDETNVKGEVVFDHMSFSYNPAKPLIEDMNIHVKPGETVAIVGPTGAGKTTLVNLIMRFYDPQSGQIILDGTSTQKYTRDAVRGAVGMVLQDTWLFSGTIMENLRYGDEKATDEEVYAAAKAARADHFIETLPGGYNFKLNEDGTNISQGQRQLLTIARAIVSKPKMMILDEATSSVDTRTEQAIQDALDDIMKDKTSFVIAHRLSTIKNAKVILVMNQGKIIETGTHEELLKKGGFYADMYNSQFLGKGLNSDNA